MNNKFHKKISIIIPVRNEKDSFEIMINVLESIIKIDHEIIVVYDIDEDTTIEIVNKYIKKFNNIKLVKNNLGVGVKNAIECGIKNSNSSVILITVVDEIFPIVSIDSMYKLISEKNCDLVSGTRYALGGKRYGGSFIGHFLSRFANFLFTALTGSIMTDSTTGIKMFKKKVWDQINPESDVGWSFAFEMSIKAQMLNLKIGEVPIISVDRLFGGKSTFSVNSWINGYMKWFIFGVKKINYINRKQKKAVTIRK